MYTPAYNLVIHMHTRYGGYSGLCTHLCTTWSHTQDGGCSGLCTHLYTTGSYTLDGGCSGLYWTVGLTEYEGWFGFLDCITTSDVKWVSGLPECFSYTMSDKSVQKYSWNM